MLKPAPIPTSPDVAQWERLRARLLSEEMAPSDQHPNGRTPAAAATDANARTINMFRVMFPGQALPMALGRATECKTPEPMPGGVTTSDGRTWMIAARVEDDRSSFPPADRIQSQELADTADCYDPDMIHRAPVILPEGGPGHWTGEFAKQTAGQVDGLSFDGYNLWALVKQNDGRISQAIADGLTNRSIGLMPKYSEAGGKPYLRHLLITAETPGITNLRPLEEFFPAGANDKASRAFAGTPTRWRTLNDLPTAERTTTMKTTNTEPETIDMDKLAAALAPALAAHLRTVSTPPAVLTETRTADPEPTEAKLRALVDQAVAPLKTENETLRTKLQEIETARAADAEAAKVRAKTERERKVRERLDAAFRSNRITAQDRTLLETTCLADGVPETVVDNVLAEVDKRTAVPKSRRLEPTVTEGNQETRIDSDLLQAAEAGADHELVRTAARIRAKYANEPDPVKRSALIAQEWTRLGSVAPDQDAA